ncbi:MAG TPA: hypothetical protein VJA21_27370 [Verrucomicrobiae bacterium]
MDTLGTIFLIWTMHAVVGAALAGPIRFLGRKRAPWAAWELLALVVPFCVWLALMSSPLATGRKSLANIGEPVYISFAMPVAALVRVALGKSIGERSCAVVLISLLCFAAAAAFLMTPMKPE